jgi:hypothetical protein
MRQIPVKLSETERQTVEHFRTHGLHHAREITRAHLLAALDAQVPDHQIKAVLGISAMVIWRTRSAYQDRGLEFALHDAPRPGTPRKYSKATDAEVAALACSPPPVGAKRWTIKLLVEAASQRPELAGINRESLRQSLKKTF